MIRYHVRDLGTGRLDPGGLNATGAAVFTEVTLELSGVTYTNIAGIPDPAGDVFHFPNAHFVSPHELHWDFFATEAGGIDRAGVTVGTAMPAPGSGGASQAIRTQLTALRQLLPTLQGFSTSIGDDVNDNGTVAGVMSDGNTSVATTWRAGAAMRVDGGLTNPLFSRVAAINQNGAIVGFFRPGNGDMRGWLREANGTTHDALGPAGVGTFANDINDMNRIVGGTQDGRGWFSDGAGAPTLLTPIAGRSTTAGSGINNKNAIVGASDETACLWDAAQGAAPIDLNTRATVPDNGYLSGAIHINDDGLILCEGHSNLGRRVYLLTPYVANDPPAKCVVSDVVLFGFSPRASVYGVSLPCMKPGDIPQGRVPVSKLCQLVSFSALDCPGCMRLLDQPCGAGWGIGVEGVPEGIDVSLLADGKKIADLQPGEPRGKGKPFTSKAGRRALEVIFDPKGAHEYFLGFEGRKSTKPDVAFPIRLTIFRDKGKDSPKSARRRR